MLLTGILRRFSNYIKITGIFENKNKREELVNNIFNVWLYSLSYFIIKAFYKKNCTIFIELCAAYGVKVEDQELIGLNNTFLTENGNECIFLYNCVHIFKI